jgi:hypothetical protein
VGLSNALAVRPTEGVGFAIGRAAVISQAGQIEGAAGNLGDCVRVDGTSGQCGSGSGGVLTSFSDGETPAGVINGVNTTFTLNFAPSPPASLVLIRNGLVMKQGVDYSLSGVAITFLPGSVPQTGDGLLAGYRYADPANPLGSLTSPQVICSSVGSSTSATTLTQLGSCTIPAGLLGTGDRVEVQFQYAHTGAATGFMGEIYFGAATLLSRAAAAGEAAFAGRLNLGIYAGAQAWDAQSWGNGLPLASGAGTAGENTAVSLAISLRAQMSGTTTDTVTLRNFTVIRYPAQANP